MEKRNLNLNFHLLEKAFYKFSLPFSHKKIRKFEKYLQIYQKWAEKISLSSIRTEQAIIAKHFIDSIVIYPILEKYYQAGDIITDLGSGGGFPGVPLKIVDEDFTIVLSEVNKKKLAYLEELITELDLDIKLFDPSQNKIQKNSKIVLTRAFGNLSKIVKEGKKYIKNGYIFALKGKLEKIKEEAQAIKNEYRIVPLELNIELNVTDVAYERNLVIIEI